MESTVVRLRRRLGICTNRSTVGIRYRIGRLILIGHRVRGLILIGSSTGRLVLIRRGRRCRVRIISSRARRWLRRGRSIATRFQLAHRGTRRGGGIRYYLAKVRIVRDRGRSWSLRRSCGGDGRRLRSLVALRRTVSLSRRLVGSRLVAVNLWVWRISRLAVAVGCQRAGRMLREQEQLPVPDSYSSSSSTVGQCAPLLSGRDHSFPGT